MADVGSIGKRPVVNDVLSKPKVENKPKAKVQEGKITSKPETKQVSGKFSPEKVVEKANEALANVERKANKPPVYPDLGGLSLSLQPTVENNTEESITLQDGSSTADRAPIDTAVSNPVVESSKENSGNIAPKPKGKVISASESVRKVEKENTEPSVSTVQTQVQTQQPQAPVAAV